MTLSLFVIKELPIFFKQTNHTKIWPKPKNSRNIYMKNTM